MAEKQLSLICNKRAAYSEGKVTAAMQDSKSLNIYDRCNPQHKALFIEAYNDGYNNYMKYEANQVGQLDGIAGFGASIQWVCSGKLFHHYHLGKGSSEAKAVSNLMSNCKSSDDSVHCTSMFKRCRRVNYGNIIKSAYD